MHNQRGEILEECFEKVLGAFSQYQLNTNEFLSVISVVVQCTINNCIAHGKLSESEKKEIICDATQNLADHIGSGLR